MNKGDSARVSIGEDIERSLPFTPGPLTRGVRAVDLSTTFAAGSVGALALGIRGVLVRTTACVIPKTFDRIPSTSHSNVTISPHLG
jgi:hypothetical protein